MKYRHILTAFYFEPWALRPDIHGNFGLILEGLVEGKPEPERIHARRESLSPSAALGNNQTAPARPIVGPRNPETGEPLIPQMEVGGGVAVIPVWGVLGKRLSLLELMCGGVDYEHVTAFAQMALADPSVHTVIFDFDSNGGACQGLPECAAVLAELSAQKHTIAFTETTCCSAAYWLACQCREFYATPSAVVGNIGIVLACVDRSKEWEMKGWKLELFASGALKGAGIPGKEWTDTERAFFRARMEKKFSEFQAVVRARRPQVAEACFDARWVDGDEAPGLGLTDGTAAHLYEVIGAAAILGGIKVA